MICESVGGTRQVSLAWPLGRASVENNRTDSTFM
jgi:hypothetical protein